LGLAGWVLGIGGLAGGGLPQTWGRFTFASASIVPAAFLSFAWAYPTPGRWPPWEVRGTAWGLGALLALTSMTTRLVVQADRLLDLRMVIHRSVAFAAAIVLAWTAVWGLLLLTLPVPTSRVVLPGGAFILLVVTALCLSAPVAPRLARLVDAYLLRGRPDLD